MGFAFGSLQIVKLFPLRSEAESSPEGAIPSSSLTSNLEKGDQLLTTHRSPSIGNRAFLQTS